MFGFGMGKLVVNNFDVILCINNFVFEVVNLKVLVYGFKNVMDINEIKAVFKDVLVKGIK